MLWLGGASELVCTAWKGLQSFRLGLKGIFRDRYFKLLHIKTGNGYESHNMELVQL
jgi:hypothetical protein